MKDYNYYKTRIDRGFYPSAKIFRQSLGRSLLRAKEKQSLIDHAEQMLGDAKVPRMLEAPSLTPMIMEMVETTQEATRPLVAAFGGDRTTSAREHRLALLLKILGGPTREEFAQLLVSGAEVGLVHPDLREEMEVLDKLLHKTG